MTIITSTNSFACFSYCPLVCHHEQSSTYSSLHGAEVWGALTSVRASAGQCTSMAHNSSIFTADIGMLLRCHLLHHVCMSPAYPYSEAPTALVRYCLWQALVSRGQTQLLFHVCVCFSSTITSISATAPRLCPPQLLLPDCIHFVSCWSLIV